MLSKKSILQNSRGLAVFEIVPILVIFVILINFSLGFFGIIHSGILNSIAARNYSFETFRNRSNLNYFRDIPMAGGVLEYSFMTTLKNRYHSVITEGHTGPDSWVATKRPIKFSEVHEGSQGGSDGSVHLLRVPQISSGERVSETPGIDKSEFDQVWVRTVYGICLDNSCGE